MIEKLIKDYHKKENPQVRVRIGRFAGIVGIIANAILFVIKLVLKSIVIFVFQRVYP